jgi:hypothetical protein
VRERATYPVIALIIQAVSDTSFYSCNTAACSNTEGAALFTKKGKDA